MKSYNDYIYQEDIKEILEFLSNDITEEYILEGKFKNAMKKFWGWVTGKNRKKNKGNNSYSSNDFSSGFIYDDGDIIDNKGKVNKKNTFQTLKTDLESGKNTVNLLKYIKDKEFKDNNVSISISTQKENDKDHIAIATAFTESKYSPITDKNIKSMKLSHIFQTEIENGYEKLLQEHMKTKVFEYIKTTYKDNGFTLSKEEYDKFKQFYDKNNVKEKDNIKYIKF